MQRTFPTALTILPMLLCSVQAKEAEEILDAAGTKGGLVVVIGWERPEMLATLRRNDSFLVHGLATDAAKVAAAREHLQNKGLYGPVAATRLRGSELPFLDNFVTLIVVAGDKGQISSDEMMRVLAPGGAIADATGEEIKVARKPWPKELDEWPHYLYDASNNAVSSDTVVAPPEGLQWTCGPKYARSHEHFGSVSAMVSTAGRVFYIIDEGPISSVFLPPKWKLVARDAFSGVLLWERPMGDWESQLRGFRSGPAEIGRRLIANGERVYVTLGYGQPVRVLDAATGVEEKTLPGTEGASELLLHDGVLYVLADDMTAADHDKRKKWIEETAPTLGSYQFPKKAVPMYGKQQIVALNLQTGKPIWKKQFEAAGEIMPATLAVADGRVCFQTVSDVACLDAADGKEAWKTARPVARSRFSWSTPTLVVHDGVVLTVDRVATDNADNAPPKQGSKWIMDNSHQTKRQPAEMVTFSLKDGKEMWRAPYFENYDTQLDIFVIDDIVWTGDLRQRRDVGFTLGRDLKTGEIVARIPNNAELYSLQMGHHRCYRNKATVRYLLLGRDGIEFVDPKKGTGNGNWWVRGTCQYGIMPANGLVYAPQHSCACHPQEKLIGFNALASKSGAGKSSAGPALEIGPGHKHFKDHKAGTRNAYEWPTYRRDASRSGFQDLPAPRSVEKAWITKLTAPLTAPVVADGSVFVAETDRHALWNLRVQDGQKMWKFVADGRIDSPPTISDGLCVFGTRSGTVYCLRADNRELMWRFRAGPCERRLFSYEQLESVWPVHGSILVDDTQKDKAPVVYFAAGRSSHLDGGIYLYALDLKTGEVLHQADVAMNGQAADGDGVIRQRVLPDILSLQRGSVFMRDLRLNKRLAFEEQRLPHLYAPGGFLDNSWWHRTYWIYGTQMMSAYGGWPRVGNVVPSGRLLAFDGDHIYGYGRMAYRAGAGHVKPDAAKDYKLFAEVLAPKPKPAAKGQPKKRQRQPAGRREILWSTSLPFVARALALSKDAILVAGGKSLTETAAHHGPGICQIVSRDGQQIAQHELPAPPVLDGMAMTHAGVFIALIDGSVACLRSGK